MLKSIFDLSEITVYDVMNHRQNMYAIDIDENEQEQLFNKIVSYVENFKNLELKSFCMCFILVLFMYMYIFCYGI